jgi:putative ABC transport system permease protein
MALGAQPGNVVRMVVKHGMMLALAGIGCGIAGAAAGSHALSSLLYDVSATDTTTYVSLSVLLASVALLACYLPARKAARVDPLTTLRQG